ncbi:MAG: acyl-CoA/acyl-ACP dehydrogenase [Alcaligenaceae bacterium]|nr:acyl-CoA/acyl-ACP dehydrogenase [Alcaligenaceae bacterium]
MNFQFNEEQQIWRDTVHSFMEKEVGREYTRKHDASREFPWEVYRKMGEQGWLGLLLPEKDGGAGADPIMFAIFCEAIAKYSLDTAACIMTSMFTAMNFSAHGTEEQKARYLPPFLRGERTFSIGMTEPQSGSDAAAVRTRAVLEGDEWVLNGSKCFISGAHLPGATIVLLARTGEDRYKGLSLFILPNDAKGLTITKLDTIVRRSLGTTQLYLDNVRLPKEALLGEVGEGWTYIGEHLEHERLSLAASYVGNAQTALDDTIAYTKQRKAFGRSLSDFQVLKHRMAEDAINVEAARLLTYSAASKMTRGERAMKEVSMAKVFAVDALFKTAFNGMQAMGGYSQLPEQDMERYMREAKHGMVGGGANEIQKSIIAKELGL